MNKPKSDTKTKRVSAAQSAVKQKLMELKGRPIPNELRYAFSALSNDGRFNQSFVFSDNPKAIDHNLVRVVSEITASNQNYQWNSTVSFGLDNTSTDFLCGLVLEFTVSAPTAVSCYFPSAGDFFRNIILRIGSTEILDLRKQVIQQYNLTNDNHTDYTRKTLLEEDMAVPGTKVDRGTGGTNVATTFYLDLTPYVCDRQWLPIGRKLLPNDIYLDCIVDARERVVDTAGAAETCDITSMYLHQTSYTDGESTYINLIKAMMNENLPIIYPYRYFDNEDIPITATTLNYNFNFVSRVMVEQVLFHMLDTASYTDLNYNPFDDAEQVDTFRLEYRGSRFYPDRSGTENHVENTVLKRIVGWPHQRNYYKMTFGDPTLEQRIADFLGPATTNTSINLDNQTTKPLLVINNTTIGSHLIITAVSKRMLKINKDGSFRVFEC